METFYFGEESRRLFGVLGRPEGAAHTGLVFCPPFGDEMICTYARFARWAKELTAQGYAVLRYHPFGTGESGGDSAEFTLEGAVKDAVCAANWLREHAETERAGLFGLRFGAAVAVLASAEARPDFTIVWSPILNLQHYFRELLRLRLTKELVHQRADHVKMTAKEMSDELEAGRTIDLLGYEISPEFYRQMSATTAWPSERPAAKVLWVARPPEQTRADALVEEWRKRGGDVKLELVPDPVFWEDFSSALPLKFMEVTSRWMTEAAPQPAGTR